MNNQTVDAEITVTHLNGDHCIAFNIQGSVDDVEQFAHQVRVGYADCITTLHFDECGQV